MSTNSEQQNLTLELTTLTLVKATGEDAIKFLNDQFTNDINALEPNDWQFNGYCSAKGRLIAIMRLFIADDAIYIIIPKSIAENLINRLNVYVFRAKVKIEMLDDLIVGLLGSPASEQMAIKPQQHQYIVTENGFILNLSFGSQRYLLITNQKTDLSTDLLSGEAADKHWRLAEINDGVPTVYAETIEKFIPQHVNLDKINGVSFKKGCFPGQEIVARLHYLGKSKQTMQQLHLNSESQLVAGDTLTHPQTNKPLTIVDAVETTDQHFQCLAVGQFE